ncbi:MULTISPECIES: hypothetical protein [Bacillus cereus group]|uniref:hypothetical protein n=1 Tax=Bacillus cereus group TaxID=86661 RepID=UPI00119F070A|nr:MULTISPECIES: hypothetical protein [Bacillus cereus group]MEA1012654.1 hypothetical protein [Bacillus cereus]
MIVKADDILNILREIKNRHDANCASDNFVVFLNLCNDFKNDSDWIYRKYEVPADETLFNEKAYQRDIKDLELDYYSKLLPIYNKMDNIYEKEIAFIFLINFEKNKKIFEIKNELDYFDQIPDMVQAQTIFSLAWLTMRPLDEILNILYSRSSNQHDDYNEYGSEREYDSEERWERLSEEGIYED